MTTTANDPANIRLGACSVSWGGVDLGYTQGGVTLTVASSKHDTKVDQEGDTPVDSYIMSRTVSVKVPMAETTVDKLATILATTGGTSTNGVLSVTTGVGTSLRSGAKPLVLHPISRAASDTSEDITIPLANTTGDFSQSYEVDRERIIEVTFDGFPDADTKELFTYGGTTSTSSGTGGT